MEEDAFEKLIMNTSAQDKCVQQGLDAYKNPIGQSFFDFKHLPVH